MWLRFSPFQSHLNCNAWVIILMKSRFFCMLERPSVFWNRQWVDTRAPLLPTVGVKKILFFIQFRENIKSELWHDHQCAVLSTGHGRQHTKKTQYDRHDSFQSLKIFDLSLIIVITTYSLLYLLNLNIQRQTIIIVFHFAIGVRGAWMGGLIVITEDTTMVFMTTLLAA